MKTTAMDRRNRVEELFHEALALEPHARTPFLAQACFTEPGLFAEVTALISAHERPGSFIDTPAYEGLDLNDDLSDSLIGTSIGRYQVIRLIKRSGMGEVYLARDTHLPRDVALKLLPLTFTGDESRLRRFTLEAEAASSLNHPNILTIHEIGHIHDVHYIATEFVDGQTLRERLSNGRLNLSETLEIAIGVTNALVASHAAGIVHRDIKPENIMIRRDGNIKVLDFGLAKLTERADIKVDSHGPGMSKMDTDPGMLMGTIGYLSPEQANAHEVDTRSDLFSLGVVVYEMITGQNPFNRDAFREIIEAILRTEPAPLAVNVPKAPGSLQKIVSTALSKNKTNRYQHAEELLADLKAVQAQLQPATPRKLTRRARWLRVGIGVIILTAIASLGFVVIRMVNRSRNAASDLSARLTYIDIQSWKSERGEGPINARFSHDGQMIAFTRTANRQVNIWVTQALPGAEPRQLMIGTSHNAFPIWSPDDQQIAFVSTREGSTGIWSIPAYGGPETFLSLLESSTARTRAWSKDSKTIYYEESNNLFALDVATRATTQVTQFSTKASYRGRFSLAPTEDRICYVESKNGRSDIWVASLHGESPFNVTDDDAEDHSPTWHPDGKRIVYTSDRGGVVQICVAHIDGSKPTQITSSAANHSVTDVSSDGTRLLDDNSRDDAAVFATNVNTGRESEVASGSSQKLWPTVSPDGAFVMFQSVNPTGTVLSSLILVKRTTNEGPITQIAENGFDPIWSPDGKRIAFLRFDSSKVELFTIRSSGEDQRRLSNGGVVQSSYNLLPSIKFGRNFCWSQQSDKIIYSSRKSGVSNLWEVSVDGATDTQITDNNDPDVFLYEPLCGADDRVAFASKNKRGANSTWSLWVRDNNQTKVILEEKSLLRPIAWSAIGSELVVGFSNKASQADPTAVKISSCSTEGGCHSIASLSDTYFWTVAVAPDGRTIAFVSSSDGSDNIWRGEISGRGVQRLTSNNDPKVYFPGLNWSADSQSIYYGKQTSVGLITMIDNFD